MADLLMAATLGPADRNSGRPRYADAVAHLYVGGSGVWQFHYLGAPRAGSSTSDSVRIRSTVGIATELAAGFALVTGVETALSLLEERLGETWTDQELDLDASTLRELAGLVTALDVAVLVTMLFPDPAQLDELLESPWSVVVATPTAESRNTQWDSVPPAHG